MTNQANDIDFTRGINRNPETTKEFEQVIKSDQRLTGHVIYGYPFYNIDKAAIPIDALLISAKGQVTAVDMTQENEPTNHQARRDAIYNSIHSRLVTNPSFNYGRKLAIPIQTLTYNTKIAQPNESEPDTPIANTESLPDMLAKYQEAPDTGKTAEEIIIQLFRNQ